MSTNRPPPSVESTTFRAPVRMTTYVLYIVGDLYFQAPRRVWSQAASRAGVTNFGYLFKQPQPDTAAQGLGGKMDGHISPLWYTPSLLTILSSVYHSSELLFVYGSPNDTSPAATSLSDVMLDYWISFATSLDPNDGLGNKRIVSNLLFFILQKPIPIVVIRSHMVTIYHPKSSEIVVDFVYWCDF